MAVYAFGSNLHGQIGDDLPLIVDEPVLLKDCSTLVAASWSQAIVRDSKADIEVRGLPLDSSFDQFDLVKTWLGVESFVAVLVQDGHIVRIQDGARSLDTYTLASMNGIDHIIAVPESNPVEVHLYPNLDSLFSPSSNSDSSPLVLSLPFYPSSPSNPERITSISSGASHSLILALPSSRLFSIGDNRYGQSGVPPSSRSSTSLHRIDAFDGMTITSISTGSFHSVVVTQDGLVEGGGKRVWSFGKDDKGQCGGTGGGSEPTSITELERGDESEDGKDEVIGDGDEVEQVCCGAETTIVRTKLGEIWMTGPSMTGTGNEESTRRFTRHPRFGPAAAGRIEIKAPGSSEEVNDDDRERDKAESEGKTSSLGPVASVNSSKWTVYLEVTPLT